MKVESEEIFADSKSCDEMLKILDYLKGRKETAVSETELGKVVPNCWSLLVALKEKGFISMFNGDVSLVEENYNFACRYLRNRKTDLWHMMIANRTLFWFNAITLAIAIVALVRSFLSPS